MISLKQYFLENKRITDIIKMTTTVLFLLVIMSLAYCPWSHLRSQDKMVRTLTGQCSEVPEWLCC